MQPAAHCAIDEEMKHSKQMLGKVLKVYDIPERNQVCCGPVELELLMSIVSWPVLCRAVWCITVLQCSLPGSGVKPCRGQMWTTQTSTSAMLRMTL